MRQPTLPHPILCTFLLGMLLAPLVDTTQSLADTTVGGMITQDTTWFASNSPYIPSQSVVVMSGATLTIEPGVQVRFDPDMALSISDGTLIARGTEASNIVFTANASPPDVETNRWGYIGFWSNAVSASFDEKGDYTNGCILEYATVEYAGGTSSDGGIHSEYSSPFIHHCTIRHNSKGGIYFDYSSYGILTENTIYSNSSFQGGGVSFFRSSYGTLTGNTICRNSSSYHGGGVYFYGSSYGTLTGNTICSNSASASHGGGVSFYYSSYGTLAGNTICSNSCSLHGGGVSFQNSSYGTLTGNIICSNSSSKGGGIWLDRSDGIILSTTPSNPTRIVGNAPAEQLYNENAYKGSSLPDGAGNIDARNVYWGTTNETEIQNMIYDFFDDSSLGISFYSPYIAPNTNHTPPCINRLSISTNNSLELSFTNSFKGAVFEIEQCQNLMSNNWQSVSNFVVTNVEFLSTWNYTITNDSPNAFYRLKCSDWKLNLE